VNATKGLAAEFAPQIRVNCVSPLMAPTGLIESFMGMEDTLENRAKFLGNVPMGRLCDPIDVAKTIMFLASEESSFITGTDILCDGGRAV
jgi:NAD(P)-dependent dehydrogenase (short-subunit alcohol dehydrogenase family)